MVMVISNGDAYSSRGKAGTNSKRLKVRAAQEETELVPRSDLWNGVECHYNSLIWF